MRVRGIKDEVFQDFKSAAMLISCISCTFKCEKEGCCPKGCCQNSELMKEPIVEINNDKIISRYKNNVITSAIIFGGLEPFDQFDEVLELIKDFRKSGCNDTIIIYSGYDLNEVQDKILLLKNIPNIIIKFGRYYSNKPAIYDPILGITLVSDNQYAGVGVALVESVERCNKFFEKDSKQTAK